MKRKIIIAIYIIIIIITLKLIYNFSLNSILLHKYNSGDFDEKLAKTLTYANFPQGYISYYNYGNVLYNNENYEEAIIQYENALSNNPPKYKECSIRINLALAMCKIVNCDENNQESIKEAIEQYEQVISILTEDNCANKHDNNSHSKQAEQLKENTQKEIDRLKKLLHNSNESNNSNTNKENNSSQEKNDDIEIIIQNIKQNATEEQRATEGYYESLRKDYKFNEKNW